MKVQAMSDPAVRIVKLLNVHNVAQIVLPNQQVDSFAHICWMITENPSGNIQQLIPLLFHHDKSMTAGFITKPGGLLYSLYNAHHFLIIPHNIFVELIHFGNKVSPSWIHSLFRFG